MRMSSASTASTIGQAFGDNAVQVGDIILNQIGIEICRDELLTLLAELEAGLDFVEEDIEFISADRTHGTTTRSRRPDSPPSPSKCRRGSP